MANQSKLTRAQRPAAFILPLLVAIFYLRKKIISAAEKKRQQRAFICSFQRKGSSLIGKRRRCKDVDDSAARAGSA
jgi:hypothetical protein